MISAADAYAAMTLMGNALMGYTPPPPPQPSSTPPPEAPWRQGRDAPSTPPVEPRGNIYRRRWVCSYCSRPVNIGSERTVCPNCGAAQGDAPSLPNPDVLEPTTVRKIQSTQVWRDERPTCPVHYVLE